MTEHQALRGYDWWQIVVDLQGRGYTFLAISSSIGVPRSTVEGWKNRAAEPKHADGERLISLWCRANCVPRESAPRR